MLAPAEAGRSAEKQEAVTVVREPRLVERVVFVGGVSGCGKTMITPIIGSLARVELQKYNEPLEHVCGLRFLGVIEEHVATMMIRMLTDLDLYRMTMGREVNLRSSDVTSAFRNPGTWRYLRRLVQSGDAAAVERIRREHPILHITMHNTLAISPPLFAALGEAVRIVEVVRHPLYLITQWRLYVERYGTDVRDFTLWFDYKGQAVPFFARGWEERFLRSSPMDRAIYAMAHLFEMSQTVLDQLPREAKAQVLIVPFELFVLDPWPFLRQIEAFLETHATIATRRELKRQRVPRTMLAAGRPLPIYRRYGWEPPKKRASERDELARRRAYAAQHATSEGMAALDRLSQDYEERYLRDVLDRR